MFCDNPPMKDEILDLGNIDKPLLVFGGPYSNLQATQAMRREALALGIPPERTICTGDVVAYCASPHETIAELRDWGCYVLLGNCEESLGQEADDCGCGFTEGSACSLLSVQWYQYANNRVTQTDRLWMSSLPRIIQFRLGSVKAVVVHGAASSINRFIFSSTQAAELLAEFAESKADMIIAGHSGIPFTRLIKDEFGQNKLWHNAGVIGMPANDGRPEVWYSIIDPQPGGVLPGTEHRSLSYPAAAAQQEMRRAGLVNGYADALTSGLWPGMDVLPEYERVQRGKPLVLAAPEKT